MHCPICHGLKSGGKYGTLEKNHEGGDDVEHLLIETDLARYDVAAVDALLAALPPSWRARAARYTPFAARLRSALGYTLLARLLHEQYGIEALPPIATNEHGKPFLVDCPLHFSISHGNAAVACAVDERPIGLDVQDILTDISPALAARIAAPLDENGCISEKTAKLLALPACRARCKPDDLTPIELTRLWTQKEASAKLDGRGLKIGLEYLPIKEHTIKTTEHHAYILSVCKNGAED